MVEPLVWYKLVKPEVKGSSPGIPHMIRIIWIYIPACLIKQPDGPLRLMYVQACIRVQ